MTTTDTRTADRIRSQAEGLATAYRLFEARHNTKGAADTLARYERLVQRIGHDPLAQ